MARVLVTGQLPEGALDCLGDHGLFGPGAEGAGGGAVGVLGAGEPGPGAATLSPQALAELARNASAIVCLLTDRIDAALVSAAPHLQVVATVSVGFDNVDLPAATRAGIAVCNTPGVLDETTADLAFALILAASRRCSEAERELRAGKWHGWTLTGHLGRDVHGATLGLVGYGNIARAVERRARAFSMRVLHHRPRPTGSAGYVADLDELVASSDIVSVHVPLTDETRHLFDARRISLMRPTAVLVNTSRGPVVDEDALAEALIEGRLYAAGLDVYEHEPAVSPRLLAAPNTVLLPHLGSATVATRRAMACLATSAVAEVLAGRCPENVLNPEVLAGS